MNSLERLGLEVAAFQLLGSRGKASLLCSLLDGNGKAVPFEKLQEARANNYHQGKGQPFSGLKVRICLLREALKDIGISNAIITAPYSANEKSIGYSLPEPKRSQVINRILEVVK